MAYTVTGQSSNSYINGSVEFTSRAEAKKYARSWVDSYGGTAYVRDKSEQAIDGYTSDQRGKTRKIAEDSLF